MNLLSFLTSAAIIGACTLNTNPAIAQGIPAFSGNRLLGNQTNQPFYIQAANGIVAGPYLEFIHNSSTDATRAGSIGYIAGYNSGNKAGISHTFYSQTSSGGWVSNMRVLQNGQVQIGQQAPSSSQTDYRLAVDGKLVAKSMYITAPGTWADFVFDSTYKYMPLTELENYLKGNKHLPTMPSANEVEANGYNMSEMDTKLLQTIEELTLRVIELHKQGMRMQTEMVIVHEQLNQQALQKKANR